VYDSLEGFQRHVEECLEGVKLLRRRTFPTDPASNCWESVELQECLERYRKKAASQDNQDVAQESPLEMFMSWLKKQPPLPMSSSASRDAGKKKSRKGKGTLTVHFSDQNDESLRKWKESLGIGSGTSISDPKDPRKVIIMSLGLEVGNLLPVPGCSEAD